MVLAAVSALSSLHRNDIVALIANLLLPPASFVDFLLQAPDAYVQSRFMEAVIRNKSFLHAAGSGVAILLLSASSVLAQTVTGSVTGSVVDPSGAVVPNATVVAVNTATGVRTPATSDAAGVYSIRFLPIGTYQVEVTASGFGKLSIPSFTLEINQTAKIDAHLTVGASTSVEVQGNLAPILDTTDGTIALTFTSNQISTIPLNGRNFSSVTLFQPGAVSTDPQGLVSGNALERDTYNSGIVAVHGNRAQANNYTLDGVDMNEGQNNLIAYNPAPDAIAEIKVISADAPATYGNVNGGDVVSVLKSGTNKLHGSAYEYLENQNLNANSWANKHSTPIQPINPFTQSQFGGTLGGPIVKNKTVSSSSTTKAFASTREAPRLRVYLRQLCVQVTSLRYSLSPASSYMTRRTTSRRT